MRRWCCKSELAASALLAEDLKGGPLATKLQHCSSEADGSSSVERSVPPITFSSLLRSLLVSKLIMEVRQAHLGLVVHGHEENPNIGNSFVKMYVRCRDLDSARFCFDGMQDRNLFTWNLLMGAYDQFGRHEEILLLFNRMQAESFIPDNFTFTSVLSAHTADEQALAKAKHLHVWIISMGLHLNFFVATALVNMYGKCSDLELACITFENLLERDVVSWNALLAAYAQQELGTEAFQIFEQLHQEAFLPNELTFVHVLSSLSRPEKLIFGKQIHASLIREDLAGNVVVATALANMYGKCSSLVCAQSLFNQMHSRNVVTWNAMIAVFARHEHGKEALELFNKMKQQGVASNKVTYVSVLDACASERSLEEGYLLHALMSKYGFDRDVIVGTAIVNMYSNCGCLAEGHKVFDLLPEPNVVSWNVMMTGFIHHGHGEEALKLYNRMQEGNYALDELTALEVLSACGLEAALGRGQVIHTLVSECGFDSIVVITNAVLNMYGKCGCIDEAHRIFEQMVERSLVSWNSIIALHAQHGNQEEVQKLLIYMEGQGVIPDETTLSNMICASNHAGLVLECIEFWISMIGGHITFPTVDHFACIGDMLGRAGQLDEAECLLCNMPIQPSALSWATYLSACKSLCGVSRVQFAAKASIEMDTNDEVTYVTLSNIYASFDLSDDALSKWMAL